jgi:S-formylglutathione hydrolase FrmB
MGPSGRFTTVVLVLAALALPVVCLRFTGNRNARGRRRAPNWLQRISPRTRLNVTRLGLVLACQLSGVLGVGVVANDWGQFYTNWAEVFGLGSTTPVTSATHHFGAPGATVVAAHPTSPKPRAPLGPVAIPPAAAGWKATSWSQEKDWPTRGAIFVTKVGGPVSNLAEDALVYLPPAFFHEGPSARNMPMINVLTGYPGTASHLVSRLQYPDHLLSEIQDGTAGDMVLVMLQPSPNFPWDTECTNVPNGPQALSFFTEDVPNSVSAQFGLAPTGYGAIGDSTGGYCAAKMAYFAPARFKGAAMLSGYYRPATDRTTHGIFGNSTLYDENNLVWLLSHRPAPATALLACTSREEGGNDGFAANEKLLRAVKAPMSADELALPTGGHNFMAWSREIPYAMSWLSAHVSPHAAK